MKAAGFVVAKEPGLESDLGLASNVIHVAYDILELNGEGAQEPGEHNVVHPLQGERQRMHNVEEDMVFQGKTM